MLRIGLTGGIGSGKSTVSEELARLGADLIDADKIARQVVEPGSEGLDAIEREFGSEVIAGDGSLDRAALAGIVFSDTARLKALEAITHPLIGKETARRFAEAAPDAIVVHDMPLLVETGQTDGYHLMVVVDTPEDVRLHRLVELRGMPEADARARIKAQATDEQRRAVADVLLDNSGDRDGLIAQIHQLWENRLVAYRDNVGADRGVRRPDTVAICDPNPRWTHDAARWIARIRHQLDAAGFDGMAVDHIGSTSVEGLPAKDVLDLQLRVPSLDVCAEDSFTQALRAAGVVEVRPNQDDPQPWAPNPEDWRKFYANGADPARVVHLHIRAADGEAAKLALQFRDWLRANPDERDEYAAMKRELASKHPGGTPETKNDYVEAKEPWFAHALPKARAWAEASGWEMPA